MEKITRNVAVERKLFERRWQVSVQKETLDNEWGAEKKIKEIYDCTVHSPTNAHFCLKKTH